MEHKAFLEHRENLRNKATAEHNSELKAIKSKVAKGKAGKPDYEKMSKAIQAKGYKRNLSSKEMQKFK